MTAFVVLTTDEKQGILHPDVVGPFEDDDAAMAWIASLPNASTFSAESPWPGAVVLEPFDGGYAGFAVVSENTAANPVEYLSDMVELFGQEYEEATS